MDWRPLPAAPDDQPDPPDAAEEKERREYFSTAVLIFSNLYEQQMQHLGKIVKINQGANCSTEI